MKTVALAVLLVASTASANGGAILIPPAEVDVGAGAPIGAATVGPSTEILATEAARWSPGRYRSVSTSRRCTAIRRPSSAPTA